MVGAMKRVLSSALLFGLLCCAAAGPKAAKAQEFGPGDIDRLAAMSKADPNQFRGVAGVARFTGIGTVRSTSKEYGTNTTMGPGEVTCQAKAPGVAAGDRVRVTGVIGGAMTAGAAAGINRIGKALNNPASMMIPEVNSLSLLTSNCAVRKLQ